jgi:hypothetical protein
MRLIGCAKGAGAAKGAPIATADFTAIVHSFAAMGADNPRARVSGSIHLIQPGLHDLDGKQLFVSGFAIDAHLASVPGLDFRMTLIS